MGTIASTRVYRNNPPLNTGEGLTILRNNQIALRELIGSLPPATITSVSSNTITPTSTTLIINVDATINTITSTVNLSGETTTDNAQAEQEFHDGAVIKIIATSGKTVTIGNSGNVQLLNNASSVTVSSTTPTVLTYNASTHKWVEHERVSELIGGVVGDLSNLTTTAKNTVVAAINEVDSNTDTNATNHTTLLSAVGNIAKSGNNISAISSQITRTSIIAAINDIVSKIGLPLSGLTTSVKSSIVAAINSLVNGKADKTEVGTLTDLTTTAKTSAVAAINELKSTYDTEIGDLTNLSTTNKDSVVSAINELNTGIVHTSGDETVAGNKTFSGTVDLIRTTDAGGTSTNKPALRIGSLSGKHLEFDGDEIMAKNTGNTVGQLNINLDGGLVKIGNGGLTVTGTITGDVTGDLTGTASNAINDVDGNAIKTTYAKLASPTFTGTPKAPTASASTNNTQIATTAFVKTAISNLINSAPTTLDTLNEIATALGNDPNFATTMATQLGLKANDADVVHKTGDEEISGVKTHKDLIVISKSNSTVTEPAILTSGSGQNHIIAAVDTSVIKGTAPSANKYWGISFYGKDYNKVYNRIGLIETQLSTNNTAKTSIVAYSCTTNLNSTTCSIRAIVDGEGNVYTEAPKPSDTTDDSTKIATTSWIRSATGNTALNAATATKATQDEDGNVIKTTYAKDSNVVHKTGDENIEGVKTFTGIIKSAAGGGAIRLQNNNLRKGTNYAGVEQVVAAVSYLDSSGSTFQTGMYGQTLVKIDSDNAVCNELQIFPNDTTTTERSRFGVKRYVDGTATGYAPSTPETGRVTDIITRDYLDNHKVEKTSWSSTAIFDATLAEDTSANQTAGDYKKYAGTDFETGYKEIIIKAILPASSSTAKFRIQITFSNANVATIIPDFLNTSAQHVNIRACNDNGFLNIMFYIAPNNNAGEWKSISATAFPVITNPDDTVVDVRFRNTTNTTSGNLPATTEIKMWGRK